MNRILLLSVSFLALVCSCGQRTINVVPYPNEVVFKNGTFDASKASKVYVVNVDSLTLKNVKCFSESVNAGLVLAGHCSENGFVFMSNDSLPEESYTIDVTRRSVKVEASGLRGFNYAIQTLRQMLPEIPCCHISDAPRFAYRGLHLDEARHFFGIDEVKKYLDIMAFHKLNTFHWHLTDDQGWRVEIKKYPGLVQTGSKRWAREL